jgi:hypothetical protein
MVLHLGAIFRAAVGPVGGVERIAPPVFHRQDVGAAGRDDSRLLPHALDDFGVLTTERRPRPFVGLAAPPHGELHVGEHDRLSPHPDRHPRHLADGADQQRRAHEQGAGESHFGDDQPLIEEPRIPRAATAAALQVAAGVAPHQHQRRHQPERQGHHRDERDGQGEDAAVHGGVGQAWHIDRGHGDDDRQGDERDQDAGDGAGRREDQRLGEELGHDLAGRRADRGPYCDLALARQRARQEQ